ncbi:MAG: M20/M25/M40 family metallo-hydrolase [Caldilineae bacterium]|nr:MAG: M20/M25/M40 family metallo-hydrolase [Caldilineae bacterium]
MPEEEQALAALQQVVEDHGHILDLCIAVQQIPAPTGEEETRARWVEERFRALGLADVSRDAVHNVYARVPGQQAAPALVVSAHTDTVFPRETDLTVRKDPETGRVAGPGIGDNSMGVAGLLYLAEILPQLPQPPVDVWLVANSNEEGLGDLKGMRAAMDQLGDKVGAAIVLEGMGLGRIVHRGLGVRRYRVHASAPGGHSWGDFGAASAIHALAALATDIIRMDVPGEPRTTFNIGVFHGGTSVNTIAQEAYFDLDLRSAGAEALAKLDDQVQQRIRRHQRNHDRHQTQVRFRVEVIGDRPSGELPAEHPLVLAAGQILTQLGVIEEPDLRVSSTDANIPLSRNIPAVCIGLVDGGDAHRLSEWIDPQRLAKGVQQLLLLTWWAAAWLTDR